MASGSECDFKEKLKELKNDLLKEYYRYPQPTHIIVKGAVMGNTFRSFVRGKTYNRYKPSSIFRNWANKYLTDLQNHKRLENYDEFQTLHKFAVNDLSNFWKGKEPDATDLSFFRFAKLIDLLFRCLPNWEAISEEKRKSIFKFIHVPLDKYSLQALTRLKNHKELDLPKNVSMNSVKSETHYYVLQDEIKRLVDPSPPIYFDLYAWNYLRQKTESTDSFELEEANK